jgi:hypothetical protein
MKDFYVYVHRRASDGKVFYVGKGRKRRAWVKGRRTRHWQQVVQKHGLRVQIAVSGLSEACAFSIERMVIAKYGRSNLVNLTDGGEGTSGNVVTEEAREHLRRVNVGKFVSDETRKKISEANKGRLISEEHRSAVGRANALRPPSEKQRMAVAEANSLREISDETREKIGMALRDQTPRTLVHEEHGELTATMFYFRSAYGLDCSNLRRLLNGKSHSCKGWRLPT